MVTYLKRTCTTDYGVMSRQMAQTIYADEPYTRMSSPHSQTVCKTTQSAQLTQV